MKQIFILIASIICTVNLIAKPSLYIIGDSTVKNNTKGQQGWGDPLKTLFDAEKINVENHAIGGRSSRTFYTEGRWDKVLEKLQKGDYVLIQFGHNDNGKIFTEKARASIKGNGDETQTGIVEATKKEETVHSYGWYMRQYISTAKAKGATPIVATLIPRNMWKDGKIGRADTSFGLWAKQAVEQEHGEIIDFNQALANEYEKLGAEKTNILFSEKDHTHTCALGANFNAHVMAREIKNLSTVKLGESLLPKAEEIPTVTEIAASATSQPGEDKKPK